MCLYPKLILNKRYCSTKKNKRVVPPCPDERLRYVTAACGECYECRKQKQRAWVTRMTEELKQNPNAGFYTLITTTMLKQSQELEILRNQRYISDQTEQTIIEQTKATLS